MIDILYTILIYPIEQILELSYFFVFRFFRNPVLPVFGISFVVSVLTLPLYFMAEKLQNSERYMQKMLKPETENIKAVFSGNERFMRLATYYRQNGYHPIYSLRSSISLIIQIPFFIAAYHFLSNLENIRGISFGPIADLAKPDSLFTINNTSINILPILMTLINCASVFIYTKGLSIRENIQLYGMAAIFLVLLYNSPAGLVLYWTMNNVFSVAKNIYYRIHFKYKFHVLLAFFSFAFFLLGLFCVVKLDYNSKAEKLAYVSFFSALIPWIFIIFRKRLSKLGNFKNESAKSFAVFLSSVILIWSLLGLFLPTQLIVSSPQEFSFIDEYTNPLFFLFNTAFQVFGFFVFWPFCLYFLFSDNFKRCFSFILLAVSLGFLTNIFLFPGNYGMLSINFVFDGIIKHNNRDILLNLCVLLVPIAFSIALYLLKNKNIAPVFIFICAFSLVSVSVVNIYKINSSFNELKKYYVKTEKELQNVSPLFSLSKNEKNIIIIMLDRAINVFMPFIFDESPELKEIYSGFTYYPNTVSFSGYTRLGAPPVFGGYDYTPEEINKRENDSLTQKHNESLLMLPRIFSENGFSVCVTDPPYANLNWKSDLGIFHNYPDVKSFITDSQYTDLWLGENNIRLPETGVIIRRNLFWYSLVKGMPLFFRELAYMDGTWCSPTSGQRLRLTLNGYTVLDYLPRLTEITEDNSNNLLIMSNNTTHEGSFLQAPEYIPVINVTNYGNTRFSKEHAYHVNAASIKRLADWFEFLKKENVYDNTRIILVSDHGPEPNFITNIGLPFNVDQFNPLLMVKDFYTSGEIQTDMSFMTNADVPSLSLLDIIENPVNPFTGNKITMEIKKNPLYIAISGSIHIHEGNSSRYTLNLEKNYYVRDNIFVAENWTPASDR